MSNKLAVELFALGAQTVSTDGTAVDISALRTALDLTVRVDAVTGTLPTLDVVIETSGTGTGAWREVGRLTETVVAPGSFELRVGGCSQYVRARTVIDGTTPSFTLAVSGDAHVVYCTRDDLTNYGMSAHVLDHVSEDIKLKNIIGASGEAADYLSAAFELPLAAWGESLTKHTSVIAVYNIANGPNREGMDETLADAYDAAIKWLDRIGSGRLRPKTIVDATPEVEEDGLYVVSQASRGWV